eukprot:TRINITY_DN1522_c0_g1_i1.p1 TRINITY_DN1522_c0_g1~~TRINITY_DN1522_c0_g1_i1.p1  ORF type:complete len:374 (+),score=89.10 TRINITY_DN1522_c0_g1_i1:227-1348(+)
MRLFMVVVIDILILAALPVSAQFCSNEDFSISYEGTPVFTVARTNKTCTCSSFSATAPSALPQLTSDSIVTRNLNATGATDLASTLRVTTNSAVISDGSTFSIGTSGTTASLNVRGPTTFFGGGVTVSNGNTVYIGTSGASTSLNVYAATTLSGSTTVSSGGLTISNGQTVNVGTSGLTSTLNVNGPANLNGAVSVGTSLTLGSGATLNVPGSSTLGTASITNLNLGATGLGGIINSVLPASRVTASIASTACSVYLQETLTITVPAQYTAGLRYRIVYHDTSNPSVGIHYYTFFSSVSTACTAANWRVGPHSYGFSGAGQWRLGHGEFYYVFPVGTTILYRHVATDGSGALTINFANAAGDTGFTYAFAVPG